MKITFYIFSIILLLLSVKYIFIFPTKCSIGYGYILVKKGNEVGLIHEDELIIPKNVKRLISEKGVIFGDLTSRNTDGSLYFIAEGKNVIYYIMYSDMIRVASDKGVNITESKYLRFLK